MVYIPDNLRLLVKERANYCCEYCLVPQGDRLYGFEVDHIIALKHHGKNDESNLSYACFLCNRHKGTDVGSYEMGGKEIIPLFNPREDKWEDHFRLAEVEIVPLTAIGKTVYRNAQQCLN